MIHSDMPFQEQYYHGFSNISHRNEYQVVCAASWTEVTLFSSKFGFDDFLTSLSQTPSEGITRDVHQENFCIMRASSLVAFIFKKWDHHSCLPLLWSLSWGSNYLTFVSNPTNTFSLKDFLHPNSISSFLVDWPYLRTLIASMALAFARLFFTPTPNPCPQKDFIVTDLEDNQSILLTSWGCLLYRELHPNS